MLILWFSAGVFVYGAPRQQVQETALAIPAPQIGPAVAPAAAPNTPGPETPVPEARQPRFAVIPETVRPGEPITVAMLRAGEGETGDLYAVLVNGQGKRLTRAVFFNLGTELAVSGTELAGGALSAAILGVPSTARPGPAGLRVERGTELVGEIPINIGGRDFGSEEIALNEENTVIRTAPDPQKTREAEQLWAILNRFGTGIYTTELFAPPVSSTRRTSLFGDRRVFRYSDGKRDSAIHAGIDYGVPRGTRVGACAAGRVVLARFRIVTGNSVIIEHLPGVYSLYYHLDTIRVAEGNMVRAGELLGESGSTGLATGPHLHWEIRVAGENTDPDSFLARPILDKNAILGKIQG
ncbi:MAG: M23 family metallopeptidase [Spirochaetaceae bacterium]|nr:M23 family metallopeptidase [Spirochaetaceae bacterium]